MAKVSDMKRKKRGVSTREAGWSGIERLAGIITSLEKNPKFRDLETTITELDWMYRSDPQIRSNIKLIILPIAKAKPYLLGSTPEIKRFIKDNLLESKTFSFKAFVKEAALHLPYGFSFFEKEHEIWPDRIALKGIHYRHQTTRDRWDFDEMTEDLLGVWQTGSVNTTKKVSPYIPRRKMVLFTNDGEGKNPEGVALLRPAYFYFILKYAVLKVIGIHCERWGGGIPNVEIDESVLDDPLMDRVMEIIATLRTHEKSGVISIMNKIKVGMVQAPAVSILEAMLKFVQYLDNAIAKCMFAQFSNIGTGEVGSHSSAEVLVDLFVQAVDSIADYMAEVITREVIVELVEWNFGPNAPVPTLGFSNVGASLKFEKILNAITQGVQTGVLNAKQGAVMFQSVLGGVIDSIEEEEGDA